MAGADDLDEVASRLNVNANAENRPSFSLPSFSLSGMPMRARRFPSMLRDDESNIIEIRNVITKERLDILDALSSDRVETNGISTYV